MESDKDVSDTFHTMHTTNGLSNHPEMEGINIFDYEFHIRQFVDDTVCFLKDKSIIWKALNRISVFSKASVLSLNLNKCVNSAKLGSEIFRHEIGQMYKAKGKNTMHEKICNCEKIPKSLADERPFYFWTTCQKLREYLNWSNSLFVCCSSKY